MARRKVKSRFFALATAIVAVIIIVVVLLLTGGGEGALDIGSIETSAEAKAVIVRDEVCVSVEKHDRVIYNVAEGAAVNEGDAIASVFKWGYTDERMQSLVAVQKDILTEQRSLLEGVTNTELAALDAQLEQKLVLVRDVVMNGSDNDILTLENELRDLLEQRKTLLKSLVQPNERLNSLYESETQQLNQLNEWKADVTATSAGRISFYFDGYEQILNAAKLDVVNSELVSTVMKNAGKGNAADTTNTLLYRVVNSNLWYITYLTDAKSSLRTVAGENYTVTFQGYEDTPYTGVALEPVINNEKVVNLLRFTSDIGGFIGVRNINASIKLTADGLRAPVSALEMKDGVAGLNIVTGGNVRRVEVLVLAMNDEYAIIRAKNTTDALTAGMRYRKP